MTTMTTPQIDTAEQLLERMLTGDPYERFLAHGQALNAGCGGLTVVDEACISRGKPLVLSMAALHSHLVVVEPAAAITDADTARVHTPGNVHLGSVEDGGYGPALGRGGMTVGDDL